MCNRLLQARKQENQRERAFKPVMFSFALPAEERKRGRRTRSRMMLKEAGKPWRSYARVCVVLQIRDLTSQWEHQMIHSSRWAMLLIKSWRLTLQSHVFSHSRALTVTCTSPMPGPALHSCRQSRRSSCLPSVPTLSPVALLSLSLSLPLSCSASSPLLFPPHLFSLSPLCIGSK